MQGIFFKRCQAESNIDTTSKELIVYNRRWDMIQTFFPHELENYAS